MLSSRDVYVWGQWSTVVKALGYLSEGRSSTSKSLSMTQPYISPQQHRPPSSNSDKNFYLPCIFDPFSPPFSPSLFFSLSFFSYLFVDSLKKANIAEISGCFVLY